MKNAILFLILFTVFHCKAHIFIKSIPDQPSKMDKRIALIGFLPQKTVPGGYKKVATYPDFSRSMKKFFSAGQPIETFPADGFVSTAESRKLEKV